MMLKNRAIVGAGTGAAPARPACGSVGICSYRLLLQPPALLHATTTSPNTSRNFFTTVTDGSNVQLLNKLHFGELLSPPIYFPVLN